MEQYLFLYLAFMLLIGLLSTRLMKRIRMPNVTGYIITGILIGPFVFGLFFNGFDFLNANNAETAPIFYYVKRISWVSTVALGFIAFSIGSSFKISTLKQVGKRVIIITVMEALGGSLLVLIALISAHFIFPDLISLPLALTLGAIAAATAPAATLMVIKQYHAQGPLVRTLLPVVALDDAAALILFAILFQVAKTLAFGSSLDLYLMLAKPLLEILISLGVGALLGLTASLACHFFLSRTNRLIWVIVAVFGAIGVYYLFRQPFLGGFELSSLLTCMMAGAIFANLGHDSGKTFEFMDRFTAPIYMAFFVISGASLDLTVFASRSGLFVVIIALLYVVFRVIGKYLGAFAGTKIARSEPAVQKYLGFALIPQAGVAIGLATTAGTLFGEHPDTAPIGVMVVAIILTSTLLYELTGPIITKTALQKAGEILIEPKKEEAK
ncbi:MAG: cation:proton antiporter [Bacilli bacterium]|nr:cation:proton antiporter [Bacilli bacterium]